MLLRSSLASPTGSGALFSPFSDCPTNRDFDAHDIKHHLTLTLPFSRTRSTSSPVSQLIQQNSSIRLQGFRRAWSDSNLAACTSSSDQQDLTHSPITPNKFPYRHPKRMLHTSPSFSIYNTNDMPEDDEHNMGIEDELVRTISIGENIESIGSGNFSFRKKSMGLIQEEGAEEQEGLINGTENFNFEDEQEPVSPPLYLAAGLGIDDIDFGGDSGGGSGFHSSFPNFDENGDVEEYYKRMIDEYPCHPLLLSNYARLLQSKGDLHGAEEYFHQATLADPADGDILMQYAKLEWELNHDQHRALINFERAVQAAPQDSHIRAAYASFLWEIDDNGEEYTSQHEDVQVGELGIQAKLGSLETNKDWKPLQLPSGFNIDAKDNGTFDTNKSGNTEEYYRKMVEENPCNSLVLRNYAEFLYQSKRDLLGAEEYYSRAILADPGNGEVLVQYAKLVWELYNDHDRALCYFEQAVEATPNDSYVLAAYASFLWETEENEEDSTSPFHMPKHHGGAVAAANA